VEIVLLMDLKLLLGLQHHGILKGLSKLYIMIMYG
jgi:hypothetical protein